MDIPVLWLLFGLACYVGYAQGVCPSGQWGDTCQNTCSAQCFTSTPCRETTSVCGCQQTTGRCQTCNQGYFGENCTFPCSDSCTVGCNRANGECANVGDCSNCLNGENSCVSGKCTACKHQMFGETCDTACSFCDRGCEQDNGQCYPEFCANCEGGVANCDTTNFVCVGTCISGTYGNDCQQTCAQFSGISNCITCIETTDPMTCGACSEGYYSAVTSCSPCSDGCVSNSCAATDGSCLQGCISGRGGRMCDQFKCEVSNCATCQTNQHLQCLTCNSGYYLTSPACTRCHENCISRSCDVTSGRCSFGCVDGWYGDKCENKCGNCSGIACDRDVGSCIGSCVPGYTGSSCKDQCSSKCLLSCDKFTGTCNACPNGKYGETCDYQCTSTCNDISCEQLTGNCIATCQTGYYGAQCSTPCSTNCVSSVCDKIGGRCTIGCNSGYHGDLCLDQCPVRCFPRTCFRSTGQCSNACIQSFHGAFCNETCSSSCEGGTCQKSSGYCSQGCKSGFWGNTCADQCATGCAARCVQTLGVCLAEDGCRDGFFGNYCNITCNDRCADNKCLQTNGDCEGRCVAGYYGLFCNNECKTCAGGLCNRDTGKCDGQCLNGYHGDSCLFNCSTQCFGSLCDKTTAKCQGSCVFGYHGDYCDRTCSQTCATGGCVKLTGECLGGCTQGYYGSYCNMTCADVTGQPQCVTCLASNTGYTCSQCSYGFYADGTCKLCNLGCLSSECYGNNGTCTSGCNVGRTGAKCDEICSNNCAGAVCEIDGVCKFACVSGYYGTYCNQTCGKCTSGTCGRTDGTCNVSCLNGFYGIQCKDICSTSCSSRICNQNSGKCLACPDGTWGFSCEHQCNRCDGPCDQDTGVCRGVCIGNTHHGDYCNVTCSSTCVNNNCQKADGRCSGTTCVDGYFGDFCSSGCETNCRDGRCDKTTGHCEVVTKPDGTKNLPLIIGLSVAGGILIPFSIAIICCCQRSHGQDQATLVNGNVALVANGDSKEYIGGLDNISSRSFTGSKYGQVGEQISIHAPLGHLTHRSADAHSGSHVSSSYNTSFNPTPHLTGSHLGVSHLSADRIVMSSFVLLDGTKGVKVEDFSAFMTQMKMSDRGFEMELATLHQGLQHPHAAAMRPENRAKNRYKDVYPYDHSRVILNADDGDYTDYINASYIDGYQSPKAYIACQGPTENMVNDFWRMIWQLNCQTIIMVTNLVEGGVTKCMQYWPEEGEEVVYGEFTIACDDVERYTDFRISNLNVSSNGEMKTLRHAQFLSWPDKEVPKYVTPLVEFHDKVKSSDTPCVVHCSAGVGRSGTYIAMDYLLEQADTQGSVNVHECVAKMRDSRVNMIQTAGQYQFLHVVLEAALKNRDTTVSVEEFSQYYNVLRRDSDSHSHLHRQFENLTCPTEMEYEAAHMPENLPKNRNANILPPDDCRVYLWSRMKGCNDYINAVYLPTFKEKYAFIATEFPQNRTVVDFCRLVYQEECRTIVMMNNTFSGDKKHENYWGGLNQQMGCGPFQIKVTREEVKDGYKVLTMEFRFDVEALAGDLGAEDKGSVQLRQYQYSGWEEGRLLPSNLDALLNMIDDIRDWNASSSAKGKPLIVHCMDGAERSGLFCVMAAAVERLRAEENVSMVHTINQMRVRRPQVIPNIEQFRYCHEAILQYIEHHYNNGDIIL
ncbi:neurogenic locus notch homolog protein 3-like isoform X4 [Mizuhopecten yessoensis]|uniref:neurogenic locus notch homolog protein 3-like isoform X4 n=1 Tax=Mizuhopecten yessoensis TaxID=6573 RepID=UPI000B45B847|nr:neurogenic locus notch homolog protein 3-like isoform X4 [Mizuhopecten yessoensis]